MDSKEFRLRGREVIDYLENYHRILPYLPVTPAVEPGYLRKYIPMEPPSEAENWDRIMVDIDQAIMPGITHWFHPQFYGYYPSGFSYASLLGDMLCDGATCVGFSWISSPACTELETIILEWLGDMMGLPDDFLTFPDNSNAGSVLQNSSSDCNFMCLLTARSTLVRKLQEETKETRLPLLASKLVAYCSKEAHSSIQKSAMLSLVKLKILDTNDQYQLTAETLEKAIERDREDGLNPFFVVATLGSYSCSSCDVLTELGPVCEKYNIWLHVDASYVGNALICDEFKYLLEGIQYASSFSMDPTKWLPINTEGAAMWVKNKDNLTQSFRVEPLYLTYAQEKSAIDYRHWSIHLSRRFRALKLWFVMRLFGKTKLQNYIRNHINMAKFFEGLVRNDDRFEIVNSVTFGLVCFRLKGNNVINAKLLTVINKTRKLFLTPISLGGKYVIRLCVCYPEASEKELTYAWKIIKEVADELLTVENE